MNRNHSRNMLLMGISVLMVCAQPAVAQVVAGALTWQRELGAARSNARQSGKGILAFFADQKSDASNKSWAGLYDSSIVPLIQASYVPLLVDWESQRALATQLGVSVPGVAVIYDSNGVALRMLAAKDILDRKTLAETLRPNPAVTKTAPAAPSQIPVTASAVVPQAGTATLTSAEEGFPDAIPADQVRREQVGQEVAITGAVVVFEVSGGPRIPFIATLAQRVTDPVEVVYWEQTAAEIHVGRPMPKRGDRLSAKGTLTDYKGRLQIKVNSPRQIRLH